MVLGQGQGGHLPAGRAASSAASLVAAMRAAERFSSSPEPTWVGSERGGGWQEGGWMAKEGVDGVC